MMRPRRIAFASADEQLIAVPNTTPLIDVMLVLLIMFIITMPLATHAVKIDLPRNGPTHEPKVHRVDLDAAGRTLWDGAPVGADELHRRLDAFRAARDDGLLELRSDGAARYDDFDRLLATIKRSGIERLAFVGNERFAGSADR